MKPVLIVAGGGPSGRAIAERCSTRWKVTVIDQDEAQLEQLKGKEIETVAGDCTSTLVLNRTPIETARAVVGATGNDDANFEFCRLARVLYQVKKIVALVNLVTETERFREAEVLPITRPSSAAAIVESQLDAGRRTTTDLGLGIGEIIEVKVQNHSPVIGKTLSILRPKSWLLGAIYRDGRLVVPHGNTEIEENDRCLLIGDPTILPDIADYFQRGASEFPLQFGAHFGVLDSGDRGTYEEALYLLEVTNATGLRLLVQGSQAGEHGPTSAEQDISSYSLDHRWPQNIEEIGDLLDLAAHVVSPRKANWLQKFGLSRRPVYEILERTSEPVLIARGTHPYKNILLAVSPASGSVRVAELAVDVARKLGAKLTVAVVCPAEYVTGAAFRQEAEEALERATGLASLYGLGVKKEILEGNELNQLCERATEFDLLITGHRRHRKFTFLKPDVSHLLAARSPISTLVLPYLPKDLGKAYTRRAKKQKN
ncbi:MAG: NAD-binding protein [Vulcanimicrobiota bacterium]